MGFYGNITNTSNTTFSFDRIYPNRLAMDANANNDGIFIGRYVLVEYQENAAYPVAYHATLVDGSNTQYYFYSSTNKEEISKIKYLGSAPNEPEHLPSVDDVNAIYQDGFYKGEILQYYIYSLEKKDWIFSEDFYKCVDGIGGYAIFEKIATPEMKSDYIQNFEIDENHYGQNSKGFKGYDSTVWVKSSVEQSGKLITKYVNIADLNSVVPTFDIAADAPTMTPITPHFDADSTNVYYKLHAQPQWGFRIAKADMDKSDENTQWIREFYNPNNNTSTTKYASSVTDGIPDWGDDSTATLPAAIYFNEDGFKKQLINTDERQGEIKKHSTTVTENTIKVEPTGKSGIEYNTHNGLNGPSASVQVDTQELTINLPSIGNMMSDAWDIIHGTNRDNSTVDSLQGRLDFFKNEIAHNEIPIQSSESEGYLVGSVINGAISYENSIDNSNSDKSVYNDNILEVEINSKKQHEHDDAWIATNIDTNQGKDGDKDYHRKAISIHHTFHKRKDSTVNELNINDYDGTSDGSTEDPDTHFQKIINKDTIQLYVPKVDKAGHVVGTDIDKIVLPYGYKHIETNGKVDETNTADLYTTITSVSNGNDTEAKANVSDNQKSCVANNTQDTLNIQTQNKWIQTAITNNNTGADSLVIAHEIHAIKDADAIGTNLNGGNISTITSDNIVIPDLKFDKAGHLTENHSHTYTLPYGYKTITTNGRGTDTNINTETTIGARTSLVADNTQDILTINSGNKWIKIDTDANSDTIVFSHDIHLIDDDGAKTAINLNEKPTNSAQLIEWQSKTDGNTIVIPDWSYDIAGHIIEKEPRTYTLPYGYKTIVAKNSETTNTAPDIVTAAPAADSTQDILNIKASNKWIKLSTTDNDSTEGNSISFGHALVGINFGSTYYSNNDTSNTLDDHNRKLDFGGSFKIFNLTTDNAGHVTNIDTNDITLPTIGLSTSGSGNIVTDMSYSYNSTNKKGTFTETRNNVGSLVLTGYNGTSTGNVSNTDTINSAFAKIENKLNTFLQDANVTEGAIDTLKELQDYISTHTVQASNMLSSINDIYTNVSGKESGVLIEKTDALSERIDNLNSEKTANNGYYISSIKIDKDKLSIGTKPLPTYTLTSGDKNGTIKFNGNNISVQGLGSAAYKSETYFAKADTAIQPNTTFTYGTEQKTIQELMAIVNAQAEAINSLQNQINELKSSP